MRLNAREEISRFIDLSQAKVLCGYNESIEIIEKHI